MRVWELKSGRRRGGSNWNVIFRFLFFIYFAMYGKMEMETSFGFGHGGPTSQLN